MLLRSLRLGRGSVGTARLCSAGAGSPGAGGFPLGLCPRGAGKSVPAFSPSPRLSLQGAGGASSQRGVGVPEPAPGGPKVATDGFSRPEPENGHSSTSAVFYWRSRHRAQLEVEGSQTLLVSERSGSKVCCRRFKTAASIFHRGQGAGNPRATSAPSAFLILAFTHHEDLLFEKFW